MDYLILFVTCGLLLYVLGLFSYKFIFSAKNIPLSLYFVLNVLGLGMGPVIYVVTEMIALEHDLLSYAMLFYGVPLGMVLATVCIIVGVFYALAQNKNMSRKILKIPIIYATIWSVTFLGFLLLNSLTS